METVKLFDAEWNLMEIVWETAPTTASRIAGIAGQRFGWAKNTTYTVLKRLIGKGVLERSGTDFTVTPLVTRRQMQLVELNNLVEKRFGGSEAEMLEVLCRDGCPAPRTGRRWCRCWRNCAEQGASRREGAGPERPAPSLRPVSVERDGGPWYTNTIALFGGPRAGACRGRKTWDSFAAFCPLA